MPRDSGDGILMGCFGFNGRVAGASGKHECQSQFK
jgi:hypothetical protein